MQRPCGTMRFNLEIDASRGLFEPIKEEKETPSTKKHL